MDVLRTAAWSFGLSTASLFAIAGLCIACSGDKTGATDSGAPGGSGAIAGSNVAGTGGSPGGGGTDGNTANAGSGGTGGKDTDGGSGGGSGSSGGDGGGAGGDSGSAGDAGTGTGPNRETDEQLTKEGCDLERPATSYTTGADKSTAASGASTGDEKIVPCLSLTGLGAAESDIVVTKTGTVLFSPSFGPDGNGVARTRDNGVTWELLVPKFEGGHGRAQPFMNSDRTTDRIFFHSSVMQFPANAGGRGFNLTWSADEGNTWNHVVTAPDGMDWAKIITGPPVTSKTDGYPNVVYIAVAVPQSTVGTFIYGEPDHIQIYKSLDGGATWNKAGTLSLLAADTGCPAGEITILGNGVVASDGAFYLAYHHCTKFALSTSRDEGQTWTTIDIPGAATISYGMIASFVVNGNYVTPGPIGIDSEDNLYVIWPDATDILKMAVSKDRGKTWSTPVTISAPEVVGTRYQAIAVKSPGVIAIAYFGSTDSLQWNGYVAESTNALDAAPVFRSATVNKTAEPFYANGFNTGYLEMFTGGDLVEIVDVKYAPNGDIWAAFVKRMDCTTTDATSCWNDSPNAKNTYQGAAGRLVHRSSNKQGQITAE
jgi:hypothetical protein